VEAGGRADHVRSCLQGSAAGKLSIFELLDGGELPIDNGGIGERPEMLSGLELGGVGRQKQQMDMLGM
jgi:hypothetical protein